jgi:exosortase E/protease (VPEID-CTERM system)
MAAEITHLGLPVLQGLQAEAGQWWWDFISNGRAITEALICASLITILFSWPVFVGELRRHLDHLQSTDRNRWLAIHLACAVLFFAWLRTGVSSGQLSSVFATLWFLSGIAISIATVLTWCVALLPVSFWSGWFARSRGSFAAGVAVGVTARAAGYVAQAFWISLQYSTFSTVAWMLRVLGQLAVVDRAQSLLGTSRFAVYIAPVCSGFEGIGLIVVFLMVYLWHARKELRFPHAFLLLPVGIAAIWLLNAVRLTSLILLGSYFDRFALLGFHTVAGWIFFNGTAIGLVVATRQTNLFSKTRSLDRSARTNPATPYLVPLIIMLATAMVTGGLFAKDLDLGYPLRVIFAGTALWIYRKQLNDSPWSWNRSAILAGIIAVVPWLVLGSQSTATNQHLGSDLYSLPLPLTLLWIGFRLTGAILVAPLAEELAFRGYLMRRFTSFDFQQVTYGKVTLLSVAMSSILFGLLHHNWIAAMFSGAVYAFAARRGNALSDAICAHATTNLTLAVVVLTTGDWSLWS